jgi:hypothetical protein
MGPDARAFFQDCPRRISDAGAPLPHLQGFRQNKGEEADERGCSDGRDAPADRVARNRGISFRQAADLASPNAGRFSDRWHLIPNARAVFRCALRKAMTAIRAAAAVDRIDPALLSSTERSQGEGSWRRQDANIAIQALVQQGTPIKEIVRRIGQSRNTVRQVARGARSEMFRRRTACRASSGAIGPGMARRMPEWRRTLAAPALPRFQGWASGWQLRGAPAAAERGLRPSMRKLPSGSFNRLPHDDLARRSLEDRRHCRRVRLGGPAWARGCARSRASFSGYHPGRSRRRAPGLGRCVGNYCRATIWMRGSVAGVG